MKVSFYGKKKLFLSALSHDMKVIAGTAILMFCVFSFYVNTRELEWKQRWGECLHYRVEAQQESMFLEICKSREGHLYETQNSSLFIKAVKACSSNQVNNVYYLGTAEGYDYFIHNSDYFTRRIRTISTLNGKPTRFPLTDDVSRWISVANIPASAAADLTSFIGSETD